MEKRPSTSNSSTAQIIKILKEIPPHVRMAVLSAPNGNGNFLAQAMTPSMALTAIFQSLPPHVSLATISAPVNHNVAALLGNANPVLHGGEIADNSSSHRAFCRG